jgi:hypothetical protein
MRPGAGAAPSASVSAGRRRGREGRSCSPGTSRRSGPIRVEPPRVAAGRRGSGRSRPAGSRRRIRPEARAREAAVLPRAQVQNSLPTLLWKLWKLALRSRRRARSDSCSARSGRLYDVLSHSWITPMGEVRPISGKCGNFHCRFPRSRTGRDGPLEGRPVPIGMGDASRLTGQRGSTLPVRCPPADGRVEGRDRAYARRGHAVMSVRCGSAHTVRVRGFPGCPALGRVGGWTVRRRGVEAVEEGTSLAAGGGSGSGSPVLPLTGRATAPSAAGGDDRPGMRFRRPLAILESGWV